MTGRQALIKHGEEAEGMKRSCLVCRQYRGYEGFTSVGCASRLVGFVKVRDWMDKDALTAKNRAMRCRDFDDMRG